MAVSVGIDFGNDKCMAAWWDQGSGQARLVRCSSAAESFLLPSVLRYEVTTDAEEPLAAPAAGSETVVRETAAPQLAVSGIKEMLASNALGPEFRDYYTEMVADLMGALDAAIRTEVGGEYEAVVGIPTSFGPFQRAVLREAIGRSGIRLLGFLAEPVAALYAYNACESRGEDGSFLVVDNGGMGQTVSACRMSAGVGLPVVSVRTIASTSEVSSEKLLQSRVDSAMASLAATRRAGGLGELSAMESIGIWNLLLARYKEAMGLIGNGGDRARVDLVESEAGVSQSLPVNGDRVASILAPLEKLIEEAACSADSARARAVYLAGGYWPVGAVALMERGREKHGMGRLPIIVPVFHPRECVARGCAAYAHQVADGGASVAVDEECDFGIHAGSVGFQPILSTEEIRRGLSVRETIEKTRVLSVRHGLRHADDSCPVGVFAGNSSTINGCMRLGTCMVGLPRVKDEAEGRLVVTFRVGRREPEVLRVVIEVPGSGSAPVELALDVSEIMP